MTSPYKVALVTGANRGLGLAFVGALLDVGVDKVYATARDIGSLKAAVELAPDRVFPLSLDITEDGQVAEAAAAAADVTLLINNAGVLDFMAPLDLTADVIERNMATNFVGTYAMSRAFAPVLAANGGGHISNVLTFLTYVSAPIFAAYNASKAASWSMAMSLRPYLATRNITISNAFPTTIDTQMVSALDKVKDTPADVAADIVRGIMAGEEDIYPMAAKEMFAEWRADQKAVERKFATITG